MSVGVIGRRFELDVGNRNLVTFQVVDPECPTIRNVGHDSNWWIRSIYWLKGFLSMTDVEKVLVTPTTPVYVVIVISTFPRLNMLTIKLSRADFDEFRYNLCALKEPEPKFNWQKEGF